MEHCRGSLVREGGSLESYWCPAPQEFKSLPRRIACFHQQNEGKKEQVFYPYHCFYVGEPRIVPGIDHEESSMCVAVPAEVIEIKEGNIGLVDYGDLRQEVRLDLVDVKVGEFVLVHVGFAIQRLSREEGLETRDIFRQVYDALEN